MNSGGRRRQYQSLATNHSTAPQQCSLNGIVIGAVAGTVFGLVLAMVAFIPSSAPAPHSFDFAATTHTPYAAAATVPSPSSSITAEVASHSAAASNSVAASVSNSYSNSVAPSNPVTATGTPSSFPSTSSLRGAPPLAPSTSCALTFVSYEPSPLEKEWREKARQLCRSRDVRMQTSVCDVIEESTWLPRMSAWIKTGVDFTLALAAGVSLAPFSFAQLEGAPNTRGIFSSMSYRNSCTGEIAKYAVEPVAGMLRDPMGVCLDADKIPHGKSRTGLRDAFPALTGTMRQNELVSLLTDPAWYAIAAARVAANPGAKVLILDAGATQFKTRYEGAGPHWTAWRLHDAGVPWQNMEIFAWEAAQKAGDHFYIGVPEELFSRVHFYNFPISADKGSIRNPLTFIKSRAGKDDFVVFKLDVDTPQIEHELLRQLMAEDAPKVDEFYYEA